MNLPPLRDIHTSRPKLAGVVQDLRTRVEEMEAVQKELHEAIRLRKNQLQDYEEALAEIKARDMLEIHERIRRHGA